MGKIGAATTGTRGWIALALFACLSVATWGADNAKTTYYIQLVRGNNDTKAPAAENKRIGVKLSERLHAIFGWRSYWEIGRSEVSLAPPEKRRIRLNPERSVEIDLATPGKRKVTAFHNGRPVTTTTQPAGKTWTVIGGDRGATSAWFIVVRKDKPTE